MTFWNRIFGIESPRPDRPGWGENIRALRHLPRFFVLIWQTHRGMTIANLTLRLLKAALPVAMLYAGKLIIDEVVALIPDGVEADPERLILYIAVELGLVLASDFLNRAITLLDALLGDRFANETSVRLMRKAGTLDLSQFEDAEFYDKMERARRQTTARTVLLAQVLGQLQDIITIAFLGAGLIYFNPWLILILILAVIPAFLSESYFNRSSYSLSRNWTPERRELDYFRYIGASDETAKEVKVFGLAPFLTERFGALAHRYYLANRDLAVRRALWGSGFNALGTGGYYAAYVFIALAAVHGSISLGDLTFLAGSFSRLSGSLQGVLSRFSSIAQSALYLQDLFDFFDIRPGIVSPEDPVAIPRPVRTGFVFENVGFRYPGSDVWAIRGVSFTLRPGEKLALVGENGAGKTTLVKLLSRLYDPTEGQITLDDVDLKRYSVQELRDLVGVIFQDFVKFHMVAGENIAVGNIDEKTNQPLIETAAARSLANQVIAELPEGYEQMLGRRFQGGIDISGGQWQKVALGRAYMRQAELLILDEPTAALDARAEYEVFQRFAELTRGKMAVLISHRFATVRMADRILVLKNGAMLELGTHEELLESGGLYAELFRLQAAGYK